jgi:hypothetical protein
VNCRVNVSVLERVTVTVEPFMVKVPVYEPGNAKVVVPKAPWIWESNALPTARLTVPSLFTSTTRKVLVEVCPLTVTVTVRLWKVTACPIGAVTATPITASMARAGSSSFKLFQNFLPWPNTYNFIGKTAYLAVCGKSPQSKYAIK